MKNHPYFITGEFTDSDQHPVTKAIPDLITTQKKKIAHPDVKLKK